MSIIGSKSSHNRQNDEVRDARERYQRRIDELIKNQNLEIAKLTKHYDERVDDLEHENKSILGNERRQNQEAITRRDMEYQKEINQLRRMHARQLRRLMAENQDQLERARFNAGEEIRAANLGRDDRVSELEQQFNDKHAQEQQQFTDDVNKYRSGEHREIDEVRHDLDERHRQQMEALRANRDQEVAQLERDNNELYRTSTQKLHDQDLRFQNDKSRIEAADMNNLQNAEDQNTTALNMTRKGFNEDLKALRGRYAQQRLKQREQIEGLTKQDHDRIEDRVNNEVNELKYELAHERTHNLDSQISEQAKAQREKQDLENEYQAKYEDLQHTRHQAITNDNAINAANIRKIHDQDDKRMEANSRQLLEQMNLDNELNRNALADIKQRSALRNKYEQNLAEQRVNKIRKNEFENVKELRNNFKSNLQMQKRAYQTKKQDLVYDMTKRRDHEIRELEARAEQQQVQDQENMANLKQDYENRIENLNDKLVRERQEHQLHDERLVKELKRQESQELATQQIQFKVKERRMEQAHQRELAKISRRNQEKLDQVLTTMKEEEKS